VREFRESYDQFKSLEDGREVVSAASKMDIVSEIREIAILNPEKCTRSNILQ
jgi:hypothetical protein